MRSHALPAPLEQGQRDACIGTLAMDRAATEGKHTIDATIWVYDMVSA